MGTERGETARMRSGMSALWSQPYVLLTLCALFWAGNSIVGRAARELVPPAALAFWRWTIALALLLPLAWPHLKRDKETLRAHWPIVLVLGLLGIGSFNLLLYTGLQTTTALNSMLIQAAQPALILIVGALVMRDRTSLRQSAGVVVSLAGVLAIIGRGDPAALVALRWNEGDAIIGVAVLLWALYSVLLRRRPTVHPLSLLGASIFVGVLLIAPVYIAELAGGRRIVAGPESALAIAYVSVFPSFLAYLFFNRGVELIGSAATGQFLNVMPLMGAGLAMLFLGEALRLFHIAGLVLIVAGIWVAGMAAGDQASAAST
jgi:Permeases of the drug/metabolite transporter (DMT) superfamily